MSNITDLSAAIQECISDDVLIQLTNKTSSGTTINTTVLEKACLHAIGEFQRIVRTPADLSIESHESVLVKGVMYYLEWYKMRDSGIVRERQKDFYTALASFNGLAYISPSTNSNLTVTRESGVVRPDMDRNRDVFPGTQKGRTGFTQIEEIMNP